jgi:hypothetical protein
MLFDVFKYKLAVSFVAYMSYSHFFYQYLPDVQKTLFILATLVFVGAWLWPKLERYIRDRSAKISKRAHVMGFALAILTFLILSALDEPTDTQPPIRITYKDDTEAYQYACKWVINLQRKRLRRSEFDSSISEMIKTGSIQSIHDQNGDKERYVYRTVYDIKDAKLKSWMAIHEPALSALPVYSRTPDPRGLGFFMTALASMVPWVFVLRTMETPTKKKDTTKKEDTTEKKGFTIEKVKINACVEQISLSINIRNCVAY